MHDGVNGWASPQLLRRYGASARNARGRRHYDHIMAIAPDRNDTGATGDGHHRRSDLPGGSGGKGDVGVRPVGHGEHPGGRVSSSVLGARACPARLASKVTVIHPAVQDLILSA